MESEEDVRAVECTTSFSVVMGLDGSISVLQDPVLPQVREATLPDIAMISQYVADISMHQIKNPPKEDPAARLQDKFRRMRSDDGQE